MKPFPTHIVAVFGVVENDKNEIMLVKQRNRGVWVFPGGQVENGENLIDALTREAREESNCEIDVHQLFCVCTNTSAYPGYNGYGMIPTKVILGFTCTYKSGEFRESDETTDWLWIAKDKALEVLEVPDLIEKYKVYLGFNGHVQYLEYRTKPEFTLDLSRLI